MIGQGKTYRIIHVSNFGFKPRKVYLHSTAAKLSNGWARAGHHVINFSDRDFVRWRSPMGIKTIGRAAVNHMLLKLCRDMRPDIVAFGHADTITPATIAAIRDCLPAVRMMQWNMDWCVPPGQAVPGDSSADDNLQRILSKRDVLDATFITSAGSILSTIATPNHIAAFMPNPVDRSIEVGRNFERDDLPHHIFFASNAEDERRFHCGRWHSMGELCREIETRIPAARCAFHGLNGKPKVFGPDYEQALCNSGIGLNISRRNDIYLYSSDRLAHMIGNGMTVCIDRATGYDDLFSDEEMVFYTSEEELIENLQRLCADDTKRQRIGHAGWNRYYAMFDCAIIAQYIIDVLNGRADRAAYPWLSFLP